MSPAPSPAAKTERLLNLVITLLWTRRALTKERLRTVVTAYQQAATDEAFERMFERDKEELRELGIPVAVEQLDEWDANELGYRIDRREYALPELTFEADEQAALGLAARTWTRASLAGPASQALRKLRAAGVDVDEDALAGIEPRVATNEPAFEPLRAAVLARQAVTFDYRKPDGTHATRRVQPWALISWHGRWYLTGFDLDREQERVFRIGRVVAGVRTTGRAGAFTVPEGHEPRVLVMATQGRGETSPATARIAVRRDHGHALRRQAAASSASTQRPGWDELTVSTGDVQLLADEVAALGPAAVALEPASLRDAVIARLQAVVRADEVTT